ncbi:MAG: exodeoxyribonuclease VII large subunit [Acutalibacteraceae bacterium]
MNIRAITVKQLNFYVKSLLEGDVHLQSVAVIGELSNFKNHYASGHLYFTLKDADAAIRCVMFRSFAAKIPFVPRDGMQVVLVGRASVYEKDGQYQFYAEQMLPVGEGDLAREFERIKERLKAKGMFEEQYKIPLPKFPKKIAVVTSETGAAVRDILNILSRRWPVAEVIMCPVSVQGESAVSEMLDALDRLYKLNTADLIIIGRGGGSAEDLKEFNSEVLAEKIFESPVPIISAVGHETDFSISDFVADLRAPTPSAAAELAAPDRTELEKRLQKYESLLKAALTGKYNYCTARLDKASSTVFKRPEDYIINMRAERADRAAERLENGFSGLLTERETQLSTLAAELDALSPLKVLSRGYAVTLKDGKTVKTAAELNRGDSITVKFSDGIAVCEVKERE